MTDHKPLSEGEMEPWVMVKRGLFYRADYHGYTSDIAQAGRYSRKLAEEYAAIEPERIKAFPLSHFHEQAQRAFDEAKAALELFATPNGEAERDAKTLVFEILSGNDRESWDARYPNRPDWQGAVARAADFLARSTQKEATEEEAEKFFASVYVQGWDQHIGHDGATAIQNALAKAGLRIVKS